MSCDGKTFIAGSYADRCKPRFLLAVGRGLRLWVESGRLTHVPEFVTAHYTGKPRYERNERDLGTSQGGVC